MTSIFPCIETTILKNCVALIFILMITHSSFVVADERFKENTLHNECNKKEDYRDWNICLSENYKKARMILNTEHKIFMMRLKPKQRVFFQETDEAWHSYRRKECHFDIMDMEDGSIYTPLLTSCYLQMTEARIEKLRSALDCEEGTMYCMGKR